jgi:stress response protein YsnF
MQDETAAPPPGGLAGQATTTVPVVEEVAEVRTRVVETGRVRASLRTETVPALLRETLESRRVEVERRPVGRVLAEGEAPPTAREEGDTLIIPVVEETAVVVKRLVLREEVRLRFLREQVPFEEEVALRRQTAVVERLPPSPGAEARDEGRPAFPHHPEPERDPSR